MNLPPPTRAERWTACLLAGAIGDAWGSGYENQTPPDPHLYHWGPAPPSVDPPWQITDDTQLTLATAEALFPPAALTVERVVQSYRQLFRSRRLRGLGASTLRALRDLDAGIHWSQSGRQGEYAAGNGAAMRIAPLAFVESLSPDLFRDLCCLTHRNDEAYLGARAIYRTLRLLLTPDGTGMENIFTHLLDELPDSRLRDRLATIASQLTTATIHDIAQLGCDAYVVHSVPLALFAATQAQVLGLEEMFRQLIAVGGDTDTNCSLAGQIVGTWLGPRAIPPALLDRLRELPDYDWLARIAAQGASLGD